MTEKKHACAEQLTQEQEQELLAEEAYFRDRFSELPCPPLPEGLSAENIWSRICADEGDHQVTVDLSVVEEQIRQENNQQTVSKTKTVSDAPKKMGERIEFPLNERIQKDKQISLAQRRRRWAVACTLVLVVGLSAAFWKLKAPLEQSNDLLMKSSAPETVQETPEAASEATAEQKEAPMVAAAQPEELQEKQEAVQTEEQPQTRSVDQAEEESVLEQPEQSEPTTEEQPALMMAAPESNVETDSSIEALRSQILQAFDKGDITAENTQTEQDAVPAAYELTPESKQAVADAPEALEEETMQDSNEAGVEEASVESAAPSSAQQEEKVSVLKDVMKSAKESQKKTYPLSKGQLCFEPTTGMAVLMDETGAEQSSVQLAAGAQLLASGTSMVEVTEDTQSGMVAVNLYQLGDLSEPQKVRNLTIQGELFDSYPSGENSYTVCTSVWFTREQVEEGDFLPTVDGEVISAEQVRVISGYGEDDRINYLLNVTLTPDSMITRADLYLQ